jgi:hypothetical protein
LITVRLCKSGPIAAGIEVVRPTEAAQHIEARQFIEAELSRVEQWLEGER